MKSIRKSLLLIVVLLLSFVVVGCKKDVEEEDPIKIGILQYVTHDALDAARLGFIEVLEEEGFVDGDNIVIEVLNPQTDATLMQQQAAKLVRESDLILAIATSAAQAVVTEAEGQGKDTPILFTAVTDPVDAGLVASMANPGGNVTGTSDMNPVADQVELLKQIKPTATKIGVLYTASEPNSEIQAEIAQTAATALGLAVETRTITSLNDITSAVTNLITAAGVDAIYIPTDNLLASSMGALEELIKEYATYKVFLICGETAQVRNGGSITFGLSYFNLGRDTGAMAVRILNGTAPKDIPSTTVQTFELVINKAQLEDDLGLTIPTTLLESADELIE
ncbi:MAG: ABC transporter substrate-binding protein [Bacilli bacterium]|nr:ABC transporter substrate-binding protein [Bacilli bacterium]